MCNRQAGERAFLEPLSISKTFNNIFHFKAKPEAFSIRILLLTKIFVISSVANLRIESNPERLDQICFAYRLHLTVIRLNCITLFNKSCIPCTIYTFELHNKMFFLPDDLLTKLRSFDLKV